MVGALEVSIAVEACPVLAGVHVHEVDPAGDPGPGHSMKVLPSFVLDEDVHVTTLNLDAFRVDRESGIHFNVRVGDHN